ncbi:MAG: hypothetical protein M5R38_05230 [Candidatus Methylomirabilis sp.]|nr:hypothetical protein [Candidatus Methylomirabilis sp.]
MTVAVSVASGVAQLASAFPVLLDYRVPLAVAMVLVMMVINLRGVRESGSILAIPSYFFLAITLLTVGSGFLRYLTGDLGIVEDPRIWRHRLTLNPSRYS